MSKTQKKWADGVPMIDTERAQLETVLQTVRDNPDARRSDGRKSPMMLAAEEVFRMKEQNTRIAKRLVDAVEAANEALDTIKEVRKSHGNYLVQAEKSRWFRLGRRLGFYL